MASTYLIVRARDLVVLAVRWEGCEVRTPTAAAPVLQATGISPKVTLTFPPQAILEQTTTLTAFNTAGWVHSDSRLTGTSELVFQIRQGATITLTAEGILRELNTLDPSSAIEMPWGLRLKPLAQTTGQTLLSRHPANPLAAGPDTVGLWQAVLRASDGNRLDARLEVRPELVKEDPGIANRPPLFSTPPLTGWRDDIAANGATSPASVTRLELSALGGSLSASARWPSDSWSHEIRLGRDQKVEVTALGRLWPFGHRVVYQEFIRREFLPVQGSEREGKVAALKARGVLVILEPVRTRLRAPTFPFDEVEILGREFHVNPLGAPADPHMFIPMGTQGPLPLPIRCRSGNTEVRFAIPVIVIGDKRLQPETSLVNTWKTHAAVAIPGIELDMIGAGGKPGDIQEVHSLTLDGVPDGTRFRPTLDKFEVVLPALRSLLPGGDHDQKHTLRYATEIRAGSIPLVPLRFDTPPVKVDFTKNADRSGALIAPLFNADAISRELGPVPNSVMDPPDLETALNNAFRGATLFGFPLASLIDPNATDPKPGPPKIIQRRVGDVAGVEFRWENVKLRSYGPFQAKSDVALPQLTLIVVSGAETLDAPEPPPTCALSNFKLALPSNKPLITLAFDQVAFTQRPSKPMKLDITGLNITFGGELKLLEELQRKVMAVLGGNGPTITVSPAEIVVSYLLRIPDAPAGMFVMRNIAVRTAVHVPFAEAPVRVIVGFASREQPFSLTVSGFGGGGYAAVEIAGDNPSKLELSLEFGAMLAVDFVVAKAEVHALGGVRFVRAANGGTELEAFIRIGGSVQLLGLITVSIELRVALTFSDTPTSRLTGRASLVIELDLTLYSETVTVDSGTFKLIGGTAPASPLTGPRLAIDDGDEARQQAWDDYWKAFA